MPPSSRSSPAIAAATHLKGLEFEIKILKASVASHLWQAGGSRKLTRPGSFCGTNLAFRIQASQHSVSRVLPVSCVNGPRGGRGNDGHQVFVAAAPELLF